MTTTTTARETDEELREELRAWLRAHPPPDVAVAATPEEADVLREWQRTLHTGRWVGINWPVEYGGRGASLSQLAIYNEELARAEAPPILGRAGVSLVGPTLMAHGTEEQRLRWMPRILAGDDVWCQLFSEPDAGSDLAGLSTRAERRGDTYVVTGQKVWSSYARFADWGIALVRTDPDAAPHKGISMVAIPMDCQGRGDPTVAPDHGGERVQRGLPRRGRDPRRAPHRPAERRVACGQHDARQRARRHVRVEGAGAARGGDRTPREDVRDPRAAR